MLHLIELQHLIVHKEVVLVERADILQIVVFQLAEHVHAFLLVKVLGHRFKYLINKVQVSVKNVCFHMMTILFNQNDGLRACFGQGFIDLLLFQAFDIEILEIAVLHLTVLIATLGDKHIAAVNIAMVDLHSGERSAVHHVNRTRFLDVDGVCEADFGVQLVDDSGFVLDVKIRFNHGLIE